MPLSRNGVPYYTNAQYDLARYESSALEYAKAAGYRLEKKGGWWTMKEHDSFVFAPNGMWFWNSHDMKGGAIEFLTQIEHKSLVEAILTLCGESAQEQRSSIPAAQFAKSNEQPEEKKPFELPPKADNYKRLFAYLCGARGLDKEIVQELVKQGVLYEGVNKYENPKTGEISYIHNAVFLGLNDEGIAVNGFERGISTYSSYKGEIESSDKFYPFLMKGDKNVDTLAIFEASIDAISHATIEKMDNHDYSNMDRISTGGNAPKEVYLNYLGKHPNIKNILVCTDSDSAGTKFAVTIRDELHEAGYTPENGYHCERQIPTGHKDFNEYLISYRDALAEQKETERHESITATHQKHELDDFYRPEVCEHE
ncbi:MAG: DUF3991 and toprim domain-containing protein [Oscillospiraceae bacterium]|nr:DUF3991 and toprim domain-containing protein [Oscillospiraceae bacterium]